MEEFFDKLIAYFLQTNDSLIYLFLFLSAIIENLFPPIPGDTITAFGAFLVGIGRLKYYYVYLVTTTGSVVGFMSLFLLGKHFGRDFFIKKDYKYFPAASILKSEARFSRSGYLIVLANRFMPGVRSVISIVAGISNLSTLKVFFLSLLSASVWNLIWIHAGYTLGDNWDFVKKEIAKIMKNYNIIVGLILLIVALIIIIYKKYSKPRN
jgi:membrane protein DedA with SNARE-associated domain